MCLSLPSDALSSPFSENIKAVAISLHEISTFSILYNYSTHSTRSHPDTRRSLYPPVPESLPAPYFQAVRPRFLPAFRQPNSQLTSSSGFVSSHMETFSVQPQVSGSGFRAFRLEPVSPIVQTNSPLFISRIGSFIRMPSVSIRFLLPCCSACFKPNAASSALIFVRRAIFHGFSPVLTVYASSAYKAGVHGLPSPSRHPGQPACRPVPEIPTCHFQKPAP